MKNRINSLTAAVILIGQVGVTVGAQSALTGAAAALIFIYLLRQNA